MVENINNAEDTAAIASSEQADMWRAKFICVRPIGTHEPRLKGQRRNNQREALPMVQEDTRDESLLKLGLKKQSNEGEAEAGEALTGEGQGPEVR